MFQQLYQASGPNRDAQRSETIRAINAIREARAPDFGQLVVPVSQAVLLAAVEERGSYIYPFNAPKPNDIEYPEYRELIGIIERESTDTDSIRFAHSEAEIRIAHLLARYNFPNDKIAQELVVKEILAKVHWDDPKEDPAISAAERRQLANIIAQKRYPDSSELRDSYVEAIVRGQ